MMMMLLAWTEFAWSFIHHGNAARGAREAGYSQTAAAARGCLLMKNPLALTAAFGFVADQRAQGLAPLPVVVRRLAEAARRRLGPGGTAACYLVALPAMEAAYRRFCQDQGLDPETGLALGRVRIGEPYRVERGPVERGAAQAAAGATAEAGAATDAPADAAGQGQPETGGDPGAAGGAGAPGRKAAGEPPLPALPPFAPAPVFERLAQPSRYKAVHGGRGSGKSHVLAELLVRRCIEAAPVRAVCIREVQRSLDQSVKRLVEDKIQALGLGPFFRVRADHILGPRGGRIIFQGMQAHTAESIKSLEGYDIAWVEEAQSLSARSLDLLRPTLRRPGSELWFSWNPTRPADPVDALFRGGAGPGGGEPEGAGPPDARVPDAVVPDVVIIEANWYHNPHFPDVLRAEMEWDRARDPAKHAHVWQGGYRRVGEARVFRNWRVEAFETPADVRFRLGADWGFAADPTVLLRCFLAGRTLYVDHEAWAVGCEIDRTPALFDTVPGARRWPITADSARPETISYMRRHGFGAIRPAVKGTGSVEDGIEFLKAHDIVVHPRCTHLAEELALYSYRTDPRTGEILPELEGGTDHAIDALRYAVEGERRGGGYDTTLSWV